MVDRLRVTVLGGLWAFLAVFSGRTAEAAGKVAADMIAGGQRILVENMSEKAITPRVIVRGWTDRMGYPPVHAKGLQLNGVAIAPQQMLTGATWILEPDGMAKWGYQSGFAPPVEGAPDDPRMQVWDHERSRLDVFPPRRNRTILVTASAGQPRQTDMRIEFPEGCAVKKFVIDGNSGPFRNGEAGLLVTQILETPEAETPIAFRDATPDGVHALPHVYEGVDFPPVFILRFTARDIKTDRTLAPYFVTMWAELDASALPRLTLEPGRNVLTATDAEASSHAWRIVLEHEALADNPPVVERQPAGFVPKRLAGYRSRFRDHPPHEGAPVPLDRFFPMGTYGAAPNLEMMDFVIDDMLDHNCNAVWKPNGNMKLFPDTLDLCERAGLRVIYQGSGPGSSLCYVHRKDWSIEQTLQRNQSILRSAPEVLPAFRDRWGILAWCVSEEVTKKHVPNLAHFYKAIRENDPTHPAVFLHNNFEAAKADLETNRPAAVCNDVYCYSFGVGGPTYLRSSVNTVMSRCRMYRTLCDKYNVPFYFMGQCWGGWPEENFDSPPYGMRGGMRFLTEAQMRMQGWAAVAEGARGLFFFLYHTPLANGAGCVTPGYRETEGWAGLRTLFGELQSVAPLLMRMKRVDDRDGAIAPADSAPLLARAFLRRDEAVEDGLYAVVLNLDDERHQPLALSGPAVTKAEVIWNLKNDKAADAESRLEPGEGTVLWIGARERVAADRVFLKKHAGDCRPPAPLPAKEGATL